MWRLVHLTLSRKSFKLVHFYLFILSFFLFFSFFFFYSNWWCPLVCLPYCSHILYHPIWYNFPLVYFSFQLLYLSALVGSFSYILRNGELKFSLSSSILVPRSLACQWSLLQTLSGKLLISLSLEFIAGFLSGSFIWNRFLFFLIFFDFLFFSTN